MPKVNLFVVGTQKGGTTALAEFLSLHPDVCVAKNKEVHIFDHEAAPGMSAEEIDEAYSQHFSHYGGERYRCDATPVYMFFSDVARQLLQYNKNAKVIVLLRDPAERALSHFYMQKRQGSERFSFLSALLIENHRLKKDSKPRCFSSAWRAFSYRSRGCYSRQLDAIFNSFKKEQVLILRNNDLVHDHYGSLNKVADFLGVERFCCEPRKVFSGEYKKSFFQRLLLTFLRLSYFPERVRLYRRYRIKL